MDGMKINNEDNSSKSEYNIPNTVATSSSTMKYKIQIQNTIATSSSTLKYKIQIQNVDLQMQ